MRRTALDFLKNWKNHPLRKPLILRGARQVGKSWLVKEFGKDFSHFVEINFEKDETVKALFEGDLDVTSLIKRLSLYTGTQIIAGETLLFLDEVQVCERALVALRFFKEELPLLHVIAAGSLIDFTLENIGLPVGRVQFLYLYPLSFQEFLLANKRDDLISYIAEQKNDVTLHKMLLELVNIYSCIGGLPSVVKTWLDHNDLTLCQSVQDEILLSYRQDFNKYTKTRQLMNVERVFANIPAQLSEKFTYTKIDRDLKAASLKEALLLLQKAGVAHIVYHSAAQALPLAATMNEKRFKVYFFDIGLAQRLLGLNLKDWLFQSFNAQHLGAITEQLVIQEYIAYISVSSPPELYYWHREEKNSNAEVDFIFIKESEIIPVEVKATRGGALKSLQQFFIAHPHLSKALKISEQPFLQHDNLEQIPFYAIEPWINSKA
jgi:predicted AAA+ superfamily ATPase